MFFHEPFGGLVPGALGAVLAALLRTGAPLTGRQIHGLVSDRFSLWSVQEALKTLNLLGLVDTQVIGRAGVHTVNEGHAAVPQLRSLVDPIATLIGVIGEVVGDDVQAVLLFGSIARGESDASSDIDLAVIAPQEWDGRTELGDAVRTRLGNDCDVLLFTPSDFESLAGQGEPVVSDILRDGVALIGTKPQPLS